MLEVSTNLSSPRPVWKPVTKSGIGSPWLRKPMTGFWALATSGHGIAAQPRSQIKSRRFIQSPHRQARAESDRTIALPNGSRRGVLVRLNSTGLAVSADLKPAPGAGYGRPFWRRVGG